MSLGRTSVSTFCLNVTTIPHEDHGLWDHFSPLSKLAIIAAVNNKARFHAEEPSSDVRKVLGDATDSGLLRFCDRIMDVEDVRNAFPSIFSIPFNSKNKWALNMVRIPGISESSLVLMKGAPEYVIKKCDRYMYRNACHVMDNEFVEDMMEAYQSFGSLAERVIGHAYKVRIVFPHANVVCATCAIM
jgi:sodium/potassium-transporting ATPase subunit alpha